MDLNELVRRAEEESPEEPLEFRIRVDIGAGQHWYVTGAQFSVETGNVVLSIDDHPAA